MIVIKLLVLDIIEDQYYRFNPISIDRAVTITKTTHQKHRLRIAPWYPIILVHWYKAM